MANQNTLLLVAAGTVTQLTDSVTTGTATGVGYAPVFGSSRDGTPARWTKALPAHPAGILLTPFLEVKTLDNGPKTARRTVLRMVYPYGFPEYSGSTATGRYKVAGRCIADEKGLLIPNDCPTAIRNQFIAEWQAVCGHPDVKTVLQTGYAPT